MKQLPTSSFLPQALRAGIALLLILLVPAAQAQMAETFSYQGYLLGPDGAPVIGTLDLAFSLYDDPTGGTTLWQEQHVAVSVAGGIFTVHLGSEASFDAVAFDGPLWLGVQVDGGDELVPRVALASVPYSLRAGSLSEQALQAGENIAITRTGEALVIAATGAEEQGWGRSGNAGTDPVTDFIGTTDAVPLELRVNGTRVMRYELAGDPVRDVPNVIGGSRGNRVAEGVIGATIAGGGYFFTDPDRTTGPNQVGGDYGTIGGGHYNFATGKEATVSGGLFNTAFGEKATIGGGWGNTALGTWATVGGGSDNGAGRLSGGGIVGDQGATVSGGCPTGPVTIMPRLVGAAKTR